MEPENIVDFFKIGIRKEIALPDGITMKKDASSSPAVASYKSLSTKQEPPQTKAQQLFQSQRHPKKHKKINILDQWVEVTVENGKTVTTLSPSNEGLIERGQRMMPPPIYVYRRVNFVHHVPSEYFWLTNDPKRRQNGGMCIQRMTVDTWLEVIDREKFRSDGHIGITGVGNMPRPKERGGCDCPVCTKNKQFFPNV